MSKWIPTWSYVPIDYGLDVAVFEDVSQRVLIRNNLRGEAIRLRFQNDGGETPLHIEHASVVLVNRVTGRCSQRHDVTIDGETRIVLPPESRPWSDPVVLPLTEEDDLLVWLYFKEKAQARSVCVTFTGKGWQSTQHKGNFHETEALGYTFKSELAPLLAADPNPNQYAVGLFAVSVLAGDVTKLIGLFGDSITQMSFFHDELLERLYRAYPGRCALINGGICGNRIQKPFPVLPDFPGGGKQFGPAGRERFLRDLFDSAAPDAVFILEGVNDCTHSIVFTEPEIPTADDIFGALCDVIRQAQERGTRVYVGTIPPLGGFGEAWRDAAETLRVQYNERIRESGLPDAVVDLDAKMRDPHDPHRLRADLHLGDGVHPNWRGGACMAEAVMERCFPD